MVLPSTLLTHDLPPLKIDCIALGRSHKLLLSFILITSFLLFSPRSSLGIAVSQNRYCSASETRRLQQRDEAAKIQHRSDGIERHLQQSSRSTEGLQRGSGATVAGATYDLQDTTENHKSKPGATKEASKSTDKITNTEAERRTPTCTNL